MHITSAKRAFVLLYKNSAEVVHSNEEKFHTYNFNDWIGYSVKNNGNPNDDVIHTATLGILIPRIIRLVNYDRVPKREVKLNRRNILLRDGHRCQYCGKKFPTSKLSLDHIIPKSRKGNTSWINVVTACNACNTKKGGKLPSEVGMKLVTTPAIPKKNPIILKKIRSPKYQIWKHFIDINALPVDEE